MTLGWPRRSEIPLPIPRVAQIWISSSSSFPPFHPSILWFGVELADLFLLLFFLFVCLFVGLFLSCRLSLTYVAPEVIKTEGIEAAGYGKKADIWSLGVIMFLL